MGVGDNIKRLLEAGISQPLLCQIERGTKNPSLPVGVAIAKALGTTAEQLLEE